MLLTIRPRGSQNLRTIARRLSTAVLPTFLYCQTSVSSIVTKYLLLPDVTDWFKKVQVGKDQEKAQSEKDSHSKTRGGKKPN